MNKVDANTLTITKNPTVLYFGAEWCSSCPPVEKLVKKQVDKYPHVSFGKVDVKTDAVIAESMRVQSLPTVIMFDGGKEVMRFTGSSAGAHVSRELEIRYGG